MKIGSSESGNASLRRNAAPEMKIGADRQARTSGPRARRSRRRRHLIQRQHFQSQSGLDAQRVERKVGVEWQALTCINLFDEAELAEESIAPFALDYTHVHFTEVHEGICAIPAACLKDLYGEPSVNASRRVAFAVANLFMRLHRRLLWSSHCPSEHAERLLQPWRL